MLSIKSVRNGKISRLLLFTLVLGILLYSCKQIDLRDYVINKVVGLEGFEMDTSQIGNLNITISWVEIADAVSYRYQWDSTDSDGWTETTDSFLTLAEGFAPGEYTLYLQVQNDDGLWSASYSFNYIIDSSLTDSPIVTGSNSTTSRRPTWSWNTVDDATGYNYQLDARDDNAWTETAALNYTPASDLSIGMHTLYVRAKNSAGAWSGWGSKTTEIQASGGDPDPFSETGTLTETYGDTWDIMYDSAIGQYVILFTDNQDLYITALSSPGDILMADKLMITTSFYHKEAVVIKTGSTYSVLWRYAYGTTGRIFFDKISSDLASITETQLLETTGSVPIGWISATWNETHSEIAVVYCLGAANDNQIYFMRIDSNGTTVEEALQITSDTASRHGSQVFWTEDDDYTLVYSEETGSAGDILYVCTIDSSAAVSIPSSTTRISPTSHDIRNRAPAYWTGSELGVIWLDSNNGNTIYFNRYNKDGSSISGGPFDILSDFTGTEDNYISSYTSVYDSIDLAHNSGDKYGLIWSQYNSNGNIGATETQFCTIEDNSGTWETISEPIIITPNNSNKNIKPFCIWGSSRWAAIWKNNNDGDAFFQY